MKKNDLEKFRDARGLSYRELAKILDVHYTSVFKYCNNDRTPNIDNAIKIEKKTKKLVKVTSWKRD